MIPGIVCGNLALVRIKPSKECPQAGSTQTRRNVSVGEDKALRSQQIQVRSLDHWMAHESEIAPALIVADDHDHIERRGSDYGAKAQQ